MTGDLIVNLYLKDIWSINRQNNVHPIFPSDKERMMSFMDTFFSDQKGWKMEVERGINNGTVFVTEEDNIIKGFACYDCTAKGYFGPMGVTPTCRGKYMGRDLMYAAFDQMKAMGYGYAIIGWVSDYIEKLPYNWDHEALGFYQKNAMATYIPFSDPHYTLYKNKVNIKNIHVEGYEELEAFRNEKE